MTDIAFYKGTLGNYTLGDAIGGFRSAMTELSEKFLRTSSEPRIEVRVVIHSDSDGLWAEVPALPGCVSQGETKEELVSNIKDAIRSWLEVSQTESISRIGSAETGRTIETIEI